MIVVDDGSRQAAEIAGLCRRHGATLIRRPASGGPGPARNDGLAQVTTPLVAFLDSDCEAGPEWITSLAAHFADPLVAAVAPRVRPGDRARRGRPLPGAPARRSTWARRKGRVAAADPAVLRADRGPAGPPRRAGRRRGSATARRWPVRAGPFDASLRYGEDVDLVWRLAEAGWRVRYDPAASVSHAEPATLGRGCWPGGSVMDVRRPRSRDGTRARCRPWSCRPGRRRPSPPCWPAGRSAALAAYGAGTGQLVRLLRGWDVPPKGVLRPMADSVLQTWLGAGRWTIQYALPVAAASLARPGGRTARTRLGRRLAVASLLVGPPIAEWRRIRPSMHAAAFSLGYLADEVAYGAGVYRGARGGKTAQPATADRGLAAARQSPGRVAAGCHSRKGSPVMTDVVVVATIRPLPEHRAEVIAALEKAIADVHAHDDGCLLYALHEGDDRLVFVEKWTSTEALAEHSRGAALVELNQALSGRLAGATDVQVLRPHPAGTPAQGAV